MSRDEIYNLLTELANKRSAKYSPEMQDSFKTGYLKAYLAQIIKDDPKLIADLKFVMTLDF